MSEITNFIRARADEYSGLRYRNVCEGKDTLSPSVAASALVWIVMSVYLIGSFGFVFAVCKFHKKCESADGQGRDVEMSPITEVALHPKL